jgi:hypothetical protein
MAAAPWETQRSALVIAHPGHELRVHHWLERARPLVLVLTDGSGHTGRSRLDATTSVLAQAGARPGPVYGRLSDRALYAAILAGKADPFIALAEEIADILEREQVQYAAGDAVEGFNPSHDLCRLLLNAALARLAERGHRINNFEFPLEGRPDDCAPDDRAEAIVLELGDDAYRRKVATAESYPGMEADVARILGKFGAAAFRTECFRPVRYGLNIAERFAHPPFYERYGEQQVAAGFYREVIRFGTHLAPLAKRLAG